MCQKQNEQQIIAEIRNGNTMLAKALLSFLEREGNVLLPAPQLPWSVEHRARGDALSNTGEKQNQKAACFH